MATGVNGGHKQGWHRTGMMSVPQEKQADGAKELKGEMLTFRWGKQNISGSTTCLSWVWKQQHSDLKS